VQTGPSGQFVYVVKPDMTVEIRKVTVERSEGETAVLSGNSVAKGDLVVVRGALRLAPGARVNITEGAPAS
jgi:multidrug efflux system membrane fusion protein